MAVMLIDLLLLYNFPESNHLEVHCLLGAGEVLCRLQRPVGGDRRVWSSSLDISVVAMAVITTLLRS